jgi:cytidylate kinase
MHKVIAIDGPSGAGKSTIARAIAERLGFQYLDTGALYRAVALHLTKAGLTAESPDDMILIAIKKVPVRFKDGTIFLNDDDVSGHIRTPDMGKAASEFSARRVIRNFLLDIQRNTALDTNVVAEGRDMTTIVFPQAWKKFFLDASEEERARRRYLQFRENNRDITFESALRDILERDLRDSQRDIAPLRRSPDALYIDTTVMDLQTVISRILQAVQC